MSATLRVAESSFLKTKRNLESIYPMNPLKTTGEPHVMDLTHYQMTDRLLGYYTRNNLKIERVSTTYVHCWDCAGQIRRSYLMESLKKISMPFLVNKLIKPLKTVRILQVGKHYLLNTLQVGVILSNRTLKHLKLKIRNMQDVRLGCYLGSKGLYV